MKKIIIHRVSCKVCGDIFCGATPQKAEAKHKKHVDKDCKVIRFWEKANRILERELTAKEVFDLQRKYKEQK